MLFSGVLGGMSCRINKGGHLLFSCTVLFLFPCLSLYTVTSKKFTSVWLILDVNLIAGWKLFKAVRKEYNSSNEWCHIIKMSLIYLHHTRGTSGFKLAQNFREK